MYSRAPGAVSGTIYDGGVGIVEHQVPIVQLGVRLRFRRCFGALSSFGHWPTLEPRCGHKTREVVSGVSGLHGQLR